MYVNFHKGHLGIRIFGFGVSKIKQGVWGFRVGIFRVRARRTCRHMHIIAPVVVQYIVCARVPLLLQSADPGASHGR